MLSYYCKYTNYNISNIQHLAYNILKSTTVLVFDGGFYVGQTIFENDQFLPRGFGLIVQEMHEIYGQF